MNISRLQTDKLIVGTDDVSYVAPDTSPTGSAILNGPVLIGQPSAAPGYEAVLNVSSNSAPQNSLDVQPACQASLAIKADGNVKIDGDGKTADALVVTGDQTINSGNLHTSNLLACSGQACAWSGSSINVQGWKGFDIKHPTKEGHRLRYICLEGPEGGVYHRGRITGTNVINLPDYWKDLVDIDSISVQLQPIGRQQNLVIQEINEDFIVIVEDSTNTDLITDLSTIDCFYHIYGTRKDGEVLIPEYKGETPEDYPGNNNQYSIAGYHYDRRTL
tara:strand:+ start:1972 stop:2796 length:825 start_codon:yes stop_codon:yes gene_type:complete